MCRNRLWFVGESSARSSTKGESDLWVFNFDGAFSVANRGVMAARGLEFYCSRAELSRYGIMWTANEIRMYEKDYNRNKVLILRVMTAVAQPRLQRIDETVISGDQFDGRLRPFSCSGGIIVSFSNSILPRGKVE